MRKSLTIPVALAACLAVGWPGVPAWSAKPAKKVDLIWTHPQFRTLAVQSIALLPAASFDNNLKNEKTVERIFAQALRPSGYRWVSPPVAREMIKALLGGDSALSGLHQIVLKSGRVDSLAARRLCRAIRTDAVMSARLDLFERLEMEWNQSGKPTTTVQIRAALVDSSGRLLWSASGSETGEGQYHEAGAPTVGIKVSSGENKPITGQGGAPSYEEVTTRLFSRWVKDFPARPEASAPAKSSAADSTAPSAPDSTR
jgi:hypothetical protein